MTEEAKTRSWYFRQVVLPSVILITTAILMVFGWELVYGKNTESKLGDKPEKLVVPTTIQPDRKTIELPVAPVAPGVVTFTSSYVFSGTIIQIKTLSEGIELLLDTQTQGFPPFIITKNTPIFMQTQRNYQQMQLKDLAIGQEVRLSYSYNPQTKTWYPAQAVVITKTTVNNP